MDDFLLREIGRETGVVEANEDMTPAAQAPHHANSRRKPVGKVAVLVSSPSTAMPPSHTDPAQAESDEAIHALSSDDPEPRRSTKARKGDANGGHNRPGTHSSHATISNLSRAAGGESGQEDAGTHILDAALAETIAEIRVLWRQRQMWHKQEKSDTLRAMAYCRGLAVDGDKKEAAVIYKAALNLGGKHPLAQLAYGAIFPLIGARTLIEDNRSALEKRITKLAKKLPAQDFIKGTYGVRAQTLGAIVGEAGDIGSYSNPGKLWKRMGLAPYCGKSPSTHRRDKSATADDWIVMGYSGSRRSVMWNAGSSLIGGMGKGPKRPFPGEDISVRDDLKPYQKLFIERCRHEVARDPAMARDDVMKDGELRESYSKYAAARAQRYVEKRFLRELWRAWRAEVGQP